MIKHGTGAVSVADPVLFTGAPFILDENKIFRSESGEKHPGSAIIPVPVLQLVNNCS
jgi:hypothetical protein